MAQKMDKNSITGFILIGAILIGWSYWMSPSPEDLEKVKVLQDSLAQTEKSIENKMVQEQKPQPEALFTDSTTVEHFPSDSMIDVELANAYGRFSNASIGTEQYYIVENEKFELKISNKGGRMVSARLKEFETFSGEPLMLFDEDSSEFYMQFKSENRVLNTADFYFVPNQQNLSISGEDNNEFKIRLNANEEGKYIEYVYRLVGNTYDLDFKVNIVGLDDIVMDNNNKLNLFWQMRSLAKEKGLETENRRTTIFYKPVDDNDDYISEGSPERYDMEANIEWISFKQQFFSVAILAEKPLIGAGSYLETQAAGKSGKYVKNMIASVGVPLENNRGGFKIFLGPNEFYLLKEYGTSAQIDLGWGIFGWVSEWFLIPIFTWLSYLNLSYGIIIFLLTIGIKLLLSPITYKSYLSGAKMKVLKPEIAEINEKHKNSDPMKKQQATMALYKKAGVNPMAGCIPMLLQMPILYAMFMLFPALFKLRGESFLWADDLSTFDSIYNFPPGFEIPFYGNHISLFTLLMAASMYFYTKSNMASGTMGGAGNEAQAKQMQIMMLYFMPVMMLVWFNNYPAGLSYYYLTANLTSIGQNWFFRKYLVDEEKIRAQVQERKKKPVKKSRFQSKMEELAKAQEQRLLDKKKKK